MGKFRGQRRLELSDPHAKLSRSTKPGEFTLTSGIIAPSERAIKSLKPREPMVRDRFRLNDTARKLIQSEPYRFGFDGFGEALYYRSYSRQMANGKQEQWPDTVLRVVDGVMSIRKDYYTRGGLRLDEGRWQSEAEQLSRAIHRMEMLPPGRGLFAMGTDCVFERGSMYLYNCSFTEMNNLASDVAWATDALMCVTDDTWVATSFGPRQVKDLIGRPFAAMVSGKPYLSKAGFFKTGTKHVINIDAQGFSLSCTPNHKLMKSNGDWIEAGSLTIGDELALGNVPGIPSWDGRGTEDEGFLIGHLIGDGHFTTRNAAAFESYEPESEAAGMRRKIMDARMAIAGRSDRSGEWRWEPTKGCWRMRDQQVGKLAVSFGASRGSKTITPEMEKASSAFCVGLMRGCFDTDGCAMATSDNKVINLKWVDISALKAVQRILMRFGIKATINKAHDGGDTVICGKPCIQKPQWNLRISGMDRVRFASIIGFSNTRKQALASVKHSAMETKRSIRITSITDRLDDVDVYDVTVDEVHSFDANGIMAHNCGVGVGFEVLPKQIKLSWPEGQRLTYVVPDSREGWVESVWLLIHSYEMGSNPIDFVYDELRPEGAILKSLGGVSGGAGPLIRLHEQIRETCEKYLFGTIGPTRLRADIANQVGVCVVMGNIRRSAEILIGSIDDPEFLSLKDYGKNPDRKEWGWMSNNSPRLETHEHFKRLPEIANGVRLNGEPGFFNLVATQKFGRFGREMPDKATALNPCAEIPLEHREVCNLAEVFPTRCQSDSDIQRAMRLATLYTSTVSLLPTHSRSTNNVIARNRRIGVSVSGVAEWVHDIGAAAMTRSLRDGYNVVRAENKRLASEAGVPESIRVTTVKPSGSISQLAGCSSGIHSPTFKYAIRRMRVPAKSAVAKALAEAGYQHEPDVNEPGVTEVIEFPIDQGKAPPAHEVSVWEQALMACTFQREWADNSVSVTLYFDKEREGHELERLFGQIAPMMKSFSASPHTRVEGGKAPYPQMPYEEITHEEYLKRKAALKHVDWSAFRGDGQDEKYCTGDICMIQPKVK